jgi:hypothetical protein
MAYPPSAIEGHRQMITLPDLERPFDHENAFWLSAMPARFGKALAHYELFKIAAEAQGAIVECGVFKGASLARFAMLRALFSDPQAPPIPVIGFDAFGTFPETSFVPDQALRERFIKDAGAQGISREQMFDVLEHKGCHDNVELVAGDIRETLPRYVSEHPDLQVALLNLDTDLYEPAAAILQHLYPRIVPGGVLILDDYGVFPGETKAVDDYFGANLRIQRFPFARTPCYIIKQ